MRALSEFLNEPVAREFIERCRESREVQGVLVELDLLWLTAWRIGEQINPTSPKAGYEAALREGRDLYFLLRDRLYCDRSLRPWLPFKPLTAADIKWLPPDWPFHGLAGASELPIVFRVCLYPSITPERGAVPARPEQNRFRVIYETRPRARLLSGPKAAHRPLVGGVSVGVDAEHAGT